ncbi:hypothetical protein [Embleya sp. NPDC005971]|uniref:hypothetical protein n=1 Tax=Embleya sp. NPDC005971 TaxID=3156724 RepID=UPI0033CE526A
MPLAVPVPYTYSPGDILGSGLLNSQVRDGLTFLLNPPLFVAAQASTQSVANTTWTAITLGTVTADTYGGAGSSSYTVTAAGWYTVCGTVSYASNSTGARGTQIYKNGSPVTGHGAFVAPPSGSSVCTVSTPTRDVQLSVGDVVDVRAYQSSGGSLSTFLNADQASGLYLRWSHA